MPEDNTISCSASGMSRPNLLVVHAVPNMSPRVHLSTDVRRLIPRELVHHISGTSGFRHLHLSRRRAPGYREPARHCPHQRVNSTLERFVSMHSGCSPQFLCCPRNRIRTCFEAQRQETGVDWPVYPTTSRAIRPWNCTAPP